MPHRWVFNCTMLPNCPLQRGSQGPTPTETLHWLDVSPEAEEARLVSILALPSQRASLPHLALQTHQSQT